VHYDSLSFFKPITTLIRCLGIQTRVGLGKLYQIHILVNITPLPLHISPLPCRHLPQLCHSYILNISTIPLRLSSNSNTLQQLEITSTHIWPKPPCDPGKTKCVIVQGYKHSVSNVRVFELLTLSLIEASKISRPPSILHPDPLTSFSGTCLRP
jgi:hypothetical protein